MDALARTLIIVGALIVLVGLIIWAGSRFGLGRLPGDIVIEREHARIYIPIVTGIIISVILTLVLNVALRIWR